MARLLQCDVAILKLANLVDSDRSPSRLFVRYYIVVDDGKRIRIDTRELSSSARELRWDERATVGRRGCAEDVEEVLRRSVVFELRSRRNASVWGVRFGGSRLLARGEVAWSDVIGSTDASVERWVGLESGSLLVRMGVRVKEDSEAARGRKEGRKCECSCESCGWVGSEEDVFICANAVSSMIDAC